MYGDFNDDWNDAQADAWLTEQYNVRECRVAGSFLFKLLVLFLPEEVVYGILMS